MFEKNPTLLWQWLLILHWLPQPLVWKVLGAGVEDKYLFHPEGLCHTWRAVDTCAGAASSCALRKELQHSVTKPRACCTWTVVDPPTCCGSITWGLAKILCVSQVPAALGRDWKRRILWPLCWQTGAEGLYPKSEHLWRSHVCGAAPKPGRELSYTPSCFL